MMANEKIKTIGNKIAQNKSQYNLDRQTAISTLSAGNVDNYEFLTGEDILLKKKEKAATIKRFE